MRPRDNQKSRVYQWERHAISTLGGGSIGTPDFTDIASCAAFAEPIWRTERGRLGLPGQHAPSIERSSWGQRRALAHSNHRITLPRWARSRWVILHELAHRLSPNDEAHGPRFVGVLIGLASRHLDYDAGQLMALADSMGVKYHIRSIGRVPHHGTGWHVARLIRLQHPMSAMDIACHLSLVDGIDATDRQVRAAALGLIRTGQARWLRGKLTPVPADA
jgi:putative metallohydrolase (TIGR04338 family)